MDYCGGGSLDDLIMSTENQSLPEHWIKYISREILKGLKYLHENNLIHQDIKASNLVLTEQAEIKIIDFGLATQLSDPTEKVRGTKGTPCFMAPEVVLSRYSRDIGYGVECDIWSFGITVIEMAEGYAPLSEISRDMIYYHIVKDQPPTLQYGKWSSDFMNFLSWCLQKDPDYRATAEELLRHRFLKRQPRKKCVQREIIEHMNNYKQLQGKIIECMIIDVIKSSTNLYSPV
ncbi:hypothetical protein XENTR_v10011589 [Xenopus tropicalis]|nr:hypothetical protein XENTR_v10011589 [Xenopus tropicalis]